MTTQELTTDLDKIASVVHDLRGDANVMLQWLYQIERRIEVLERKPEEQKEEDA